MAISNQRKNLHLLWRAGFGPAVEELGQVAEASPAAWFQAMVKASAKQPSYIDVADGAVKGLLMGIGEINRLQQLSDDQKKMLREKSKDGIKSLNLTWLGQMVNSDQQLREKMSLFWHGHFATRTINILYQQQLLDVMRRNALGNFGDLLREVSKSASMINFLNNNQNRKDHPNENFAREVMELFTLGRGNYTEDDIKESARAFTGWGATLQGDFVFRQQLHDTGSKTFLGKTGNFNGDDILDVLLEQKQTARFVTRKIYRYFVNDQVDNDKVEWLSNRFYQSNYNIRVLMTDIFTSNWFYAEENIGVKIKSPVELIAGIRRMLPMELRNEEVQLLLQRVLGQLLFYPPNVAGWPGGKNWIDSSTLMMRLRIPQLIYAGDKFQVKPKEDDDQQMGMAEKETMAINKNSAGGIKPGQQVLATINWDAYLPQFNSIPGESLVDAISGFLLQTRGSISAGTLKSHTDSSSRNQFVKTATIQLMSTPEYQLC